MECIACLGIGIFETNTCPLCNGQKIASKDQNNRFLLERIYKQNQQANNHQK